jgi:hypothetical protein
MTIKLETAPDIVVIGGELDSQEQGADRLILPCLWQQDLVVVCERLVIFALNTPSVQHSFSFFKSGAGSAMGSDGVVMTTSGRFWSLKVAEYLKGMTDWVSVRHDTNAQDSSESASHTDEGGRIWAGLQLRLYR